MTEHTGEPPEKWLGFIEQRFLGEGSSIVSDFLGDASILLDPEGLYKATDAPGGLTRQQVEDLKVLIRQHYCCHLAPDFRNTFWAIPQATIWRWRQLGIVGPTAQRALTEGIDDAVLAARLAEVLDTGASYATMKRLAQERPRSRVEDLARELASERLFFALDHLAWRHADTVARIAIEARQRIVNKQIADYVGGTMIAHGRPVRSNRHLAQVLRERMDQDDIGRDWLRVAVTEVNWATNYGNAVHYQEQGRKRCYFRVHPDACASCKRLLLRDGVPIVFPLDQILEEAARGGGTNVGRPERDWVPTLTQHPWCRCRIMPFVERMPFAPPRHVL